MKEKVITQENKPQYESQYNRLIRFIENKFGIFPPHFNRIQVKKTPMRLTYIYDKSWSNNYFHINCQMSTEKYELKYEMNNRKIVEYFNESDIQRSLKK